MSTGKRGSDVLGIVGIVTVGICGAVLTYVSIVALQAVYMNDTSEKHAVSGYKNQASMRTSLKAAQLTTIGEYRGTQAAAGGAATYKVPIDRAMELVVRDAARDPANLVPGHPSSTPSILPVFGRPQPIPAAPVPPADAPVVPPADGAVVPPADGAVVPPTGAAVPPADGAVVPPADGAAAPTGAAVAPVAPAAQGGNGQ